MGHVDIELLAALLLAHQGKTPLALDIGCVTPGFQLLELYYSTNYCPRIKSSQNTMMVLSDSCPEVALMLDGMLMPKASTANEDVAVKMEEEDLLFSKARIAN